MSVKKYIGYMATVAILTLHHSLSAQEYAPWLRSDPEDFTGAVADGKLIYSKNLDRVIFTWRFEREDGSRFLGGFDGEQWQVVYDGFNSHIQTAIDWDGGLLVGGSTALIGDVNMPRAALFKDGVWSFPWHFDDGIIRRFRVLNGYLTAIGSFTSIDGLPIRWAARLVDDVWEPLFNLPDNTPHLITLDIEWYQDHYYIGGRFQVPNGPRDLMRLENGVPQEVGEGLAGPYHTVHNLLVYNNELIIAGAISYDSGNAGNHILRWDGDSLKALGPIFQNSDGNYNMWRMRDGLWESDGYLYVCGGMELIGGEEISCVARWNGHQWCGFYGTQAFAPYPRSAAEIDGKLIMFQALHTNPMPGEPTNFWLYPDKNVIANCTDPILNTLDAKPQAQLTLHPNPAHTHTTLTSAQQPMERIALYDLQGRMLHEAAPGTLSYRIPLAGLPAGMYVVQVQVGGAVLRRKVVVE